jgi:hypothetical protein
MKMARTIYFNLSPLAARGLKRAYASIGARAWIEEVENDEDVVLIVEQAQPDTATGSVRPSAASRRREDEAHRE